MIIDEVSPRERYVNLKYIEDLAAYVHSDVPNFSVAGWFNIPITKSLTPNDLIMSDNYSTVISYLKSELKKKLEIINRVSCNLQPSRNMTRFILL